jgi:hypothetical protein
MHYNNNVNFFVPKHIKDDTTGTINAGLALVPYGAAIVYTVDKNSIVRIVPAADMYVKFSSAVPTVIADATNILLKANQEYFISSGQCQFMSASVNTANVTICQDAGW